MSKRSRSKHPKHKPVVQCIPHEPVAVPVPSELVAWTNAPSARLARSHWVHVAVAVLLSGLCASLYTWTADFPMVFDDHTYMIDNPFFRDAGYFGYLENFKEFANRPARMGSDPDYAVNAILRPVAYTSFYLNYLMDGFNPRWFRGVNIIIHALNSLLIYALVNVLLNRSSLEGGFKRGSVLFISVTAALLFAAHPLAIESVTYIVQRFTSMVVLFSLLALWLYFVSFSSRSRVALWLLRSGSVLAVLLAMQTKEDGFFVPLLAVLLDWRVLGSRLRPSVIRALPLLLCMPLIPVLVLLTAAAQSGGFDWHAAVNIVNSRAAPLSHWHYIVTQLTVVAHYLRQCFWPVGLNLDPEWPLYQSLWEKPVLLALGVLAGLLASTWWLFRRFRGDARFALGFTSVLWFFITVSVSSGLVPLPDLVAEHRSYMPSIGIFILVACLLDQFRSVDFRSRVPRVLVPVVTVICVAALSWKTSVRNEVWRTNESLWKDTVAKSPGKYRTWGNLGAAYSNGGKEEKAVECYRAALKIQPQFQNGLLNLSNSLLRLNRPKESLDTTLQRIQMDKSGSSKSSVAFTLGLGLAGVGRYDEAVSVFRQIMAANPNDTQTRKALGFVYLQTGLPHRALDHFQHAASIQPEDSHLQMLIQAAETAMAEKRRLR